MSNKKPGILILSAIALIITVILLFWKPTVLIYGVQNAGLYAAIALPMALVLGIVHIVNLAHGEMMILAAYMTYNVSRMTGMDPLVAMIPTAVVMFAVGIILYNVTIKRALKAPELNQLILTFGIAMVISQGINLVATSQPKKLSVDYVSSSLKIGDLSFGTYSFVFVLVAVLMLTGLMLFLKKTRTGKAALAVGQNPKGAAIVGINVNRTYMLIFALSSALLGIMGSFFLTKMSIFPTAGGPFTMKSFCIVAMAGIGNLPAVLIGSVILGISESFIASFRGMSGWANIIFFVIIIIVILSRSIKGRKM
jgi:branched-chain amino acid transport system permease protein